MQSKNVQKFNIFESNLKASDEVIINLLSNFRNDDYVRYPILFDLIVHKKTKILEYLFKKGVPLTYRDEAGANALHVACGAFGDFEIVKLLTQNGILNDINAKTDEGETPFLLAVMYDHSDIIKYFLRYFKPDLSVCTISGETVFSLAKKNNNLKILTYLEKANMSKDIQNKIARALSEIYFDEPQKVVDGWHIDYIDPSLLKNKKMWIQKGVEYFLESCILVKKMNQPWHVVLAIYLRDVKKPQQLKLRTLSDLQRLFSDTPPEILVYLPGVISASDLGEKIAFGDIPAGIEARFCQTYDKRDGVYRRTISLMHQD